MKKGLQFVFVASLMVPLAAKPWGYNGMLRKGFHIGLSGSANSTWIFNQNNYNVLRLFATPIVRQSEPDYKFTWGGNIGVRLGYNFHPNLGVEFEPSYGFSGQKYDDDFVGAVDVNNPGSPYYVPYGAYCNVKRTVRFQYVNLPVYFKYQTYIGDEANFYLMLGPQLNIRTHGYEQVLVNHTEYIDSTRFTVNEKFNRIDAGVSLATGVDIFAKDWLYFSLGLVTYLGLTDLNGKALREIDWYSKNNTEYQQSRNFYVGLHMGVHFYIGDDWGY